jgi:hypothetical protein
MWGFQHGLETRGKINKHNETQRFANARQIDETGLIDLPMQGRKFTWSNGRDQ